MAIRINEGKVYSGPTQQNVNVEVLNDVKCLMHVRKI